MLRRRKFIRIISYLVALCVVFAASGVFTARAKADYENSLGRVRLEGLASLTEYSREISSGLRLLAVSSGESIVDSSSYVSARAVGALGSLGCFYSEKVDNLTRFFSGAYDFSESFSGNEESRKAAVKLSDYSQGIYYHLSDLTNAVVNGEYTLTEHDSIYRKSGLPYFEDELDYFGSNGEEIFEIISPASAESRNSFFLKGKDNVSADEAKRTASKITGIPEALWRSKETDGKGGFVIYSLTDGDIEVDITKAGGTVCRLINPKPCDTVVYSLEDAEKKAVDFLEIHGFGNMTVIDSAENIFTADFVFVPRVSGALLLTANVEINICLVSGAVTFFDATDYILRYRTDIAAVNGNPDISSFIPQMLTLKETHVCFADIDGTEKLCSLAVCTFGNNKVYIFIDYYSMKIIKTLMACEQEQ